MPEWGPDIMKRLRLVTLDSERRSRTDFIAYYFEGHNLRKRFYSIPKVQNSDDLKSKFPFLESTKSLEKCQLEFYYKI